MNHRLVTLYKINVSNSGAAHNALELHLLINLRIILSINQLVFGLLNDAKSVKRFFVLISTTKETNKYSHLRS